MRTIQEVEREISILLEEKHAIQEAQNEIDFKNREGDFKNATCVGENRCYWIYTCNRPEKKFNKACPKWKYNPN